VRRLCAISLLSAGVLIINTFYIQLIGSGTGMYSGLFEVGALSNSMSLFILIISGILLLIWPNISQLVKPIVPQLSDKLSPNFIEIKETYNLISNKNKSKQYSLIVLFNILGALLLVSSSDLISVYLSIELQSFGLYILATLYKEKLSSTSAGLKYFLLGGLSSCIILLGSGLIYTYTGLTNLELIYTLLSIYSNTNFSDVNGIGIGFFLIFAGFLFKISAAPFHNWAPERELGKFSNVGWKLSNSGNTLELMIPSHSRKAGGGWTNHSCTVTSHKASEKNVGNRGSKSELNYSVKEQRVNGSWCGINLSHLRYTLMGFERNYPVRIPSNHIIQRRFYSIESASKLTQLIKPWFMSGFTDAEGCFLIIVRKSHKSKLGWQIEANFTINLHSKDLDLLRLIQTYFDGVGRIGKERNSCCDYTVGSLEQIVTKVIPHFDKYPLKTKKYSDYLLFKEAVMIMQSGEHLTKEGLQKIINIRASLNNGLTTALEEAFPNSNPFPRPPVPLDNVKIHPLWVAGFTSGDGCFKVSIRESKLYKAGSTVVLIFVLTQHIRDELLLKSFIDFFECGNTYSYLNYTEFKCQSFKDNCNKIIPFFKKYPILGVKAQDFEDWVKAAEMAQSKEHLTREGLDQIRQIKAGMNRGRLLK